MKKSLIAAAAAGIIWYGPGSAQATYCTVRTPQYCPTTTPATTAPPTTQPPTTVPATTLPPTTLPATTLPTTVPEIVTTLPATTVPATTLPSTTAVIDESSTTVPATTIPPELPPTGATDETLWIALAAGATLAAGFGIATAARRGVK